MRSLFQPTSFYLFICLHSHNMLWASQTLATVLARADSQEDRNVQLIMHSKDGQPMLYAEHVWYADIAILMQV